MNARQRPFYGGKARQMDKLVVVGEPRVSFNPGVVTRKMLLVMAAADGLSPSALMRRLVEAEAERRHLTAEMLLGVSGKNGVE
jgi:hypothetical protein